LISSRTISADDSTAGPRLFDGKAGLNRSATRTAVTVRHEREQGDERFLTHAQHELRTVAAYGRMPDGDERENSTWSARAGGRRDETRVQLGASETVMARGGMGESTV
ncbi:hypothetical protein ALC62_05039, partial [Cyphomyrmex costatus]